MKDELLRIMQFKKKVFLRRMHFQDSIFKNNVFLERMYFKEE